MNEIVIRDLDEATLAERRQEAERLGLTLEAYLTRQLEEAGMTPRERFLAAAERVRAREAGRPHSDSVEILRAIRDE